MPFFLLIVAPNWRFIMKNGGICTSSLKSMAIKRAEKVQVPFSPSFIYSWFIELLLHSHPKTLVLACFEPKKYMYQNLYFSHMEKNLQKYFSKFAGLGI